MSKVYDKIILFVALIALGGGLAVYFTAGTADPVAGAAAPADNPYEALTVDVRESPVPEWPKARPQSPDSPNEVFSLFTPPKIYLDPDGTFIFERPDITTVVAAPEAGIELIRLKREPYRLQLEGYVQEDLSDPSKSLLLFDDVEQGKSVRARVGDEKPDSDFKVLDFTIEVDRDAERTSIVRTATATILDTRLGEEVVLTQGERLFEDGITIVLRVVETGERLALDDDTETFEAGGFEYTLLEINLEQAFITVEKEVEFDEEERPNPTFRLVEEERGNNRTMETSPPEGQTARPDTNEQPGSDSGPDDLDSIFGL